MAKRAVTAPADGKRPSPLITVLVGYETFAGRIAERVETLARAPELSTSFAPAASS